MAIGKEIGRKLSVGSFFDKAGILETVLGNKTENHFLVRFQGVVTGLKPYKIREGERAGEVAYGLIGQFEAMNRDGETLEGAVCYLPGYVNDLVVASFSASDDISSIRIAFDVYARYDAASATSYIFTVNDLLNEGSQGVEEVKAMTKALPLPGKVPALTDGTKGK